MAAGYTELFLEQGTSFETTITVSDTYGDIYALSGYTCHSQMRKSYYSTTSYSFNTQIDPAAGAITLTMSVNTTNNLAPGRYVFDVILRNNDDASITRILEGIVNVSPAVTRL